MFFLINWIILYIHCNIDCISNLHNQSNHLHKQCLWDAVGLRWLHNSSRRCPLAECWKWVRGKELRFSEALTKFLCYTILFIKSSGLFIYKIDCFSCKDIGVYYRVIEFQRRSEETSKIIKSNCQPSATTATPKASFYWYHHPSNLMRLWGL